VNSLAQAKQGKWLVQIEPTLDDEFASNSP
jgi:hypothetical protein